ncbi:MAG: hypothetical protein V4649_19270 [Bacteroidota bacterium]
MANIAAFGQGMAKLRAKDSATVSSGDRKLLSTSRFMNAGIPQNHYASHLGFFCRQELKMQKANLPVIFRVGRVEDCNRLEQKPGYKN